MSEGDDVRNARNRAGSALRDLGHAFVGREMTADRIDRLTDVLNDIAEELWPGERRVREIDDRRFADYEIPEGRMEPEYSDRPISGGGSPWGLDIDLFREGDDIVAHVTLRAAHEGAPGRAHGGIVAALFDDVMGFVLGLVHQPAFTGELTIRYVGPTPLYSVLECRARCARRDGRKLFMTGELTELDSGTVCSTAQATFIAVDGYVDDTAERPAPDTAPSRPAPE